jgi:type I restriction enzyme S subunit
MSDFAQVSSYSASFNGNTAPLEDLCISITDCPHSTPKWTDSGLIVLRSNNIKGGVIDLSTPSYTDHVSFQERVKRATPEAGDIVITREAPMGEVCLIPDGLKCCLGQRMVLLKVDSTKISNQYLLFALQSDFVQKQIRKSDRTGSTVSNLCIPDLKALEIPILFNTDGIAATLKAITGKIELNNRINAEIEAMAKTLYDYWFVQFDFPDANGKPYKTSGGKMVYNPTLKREIPEGWEAENVLSVANLLGGGTPTKTKPEYWNGTIPFFTPSDSDKNVFSVATENYITDEGLKKSSTRLFERHTVFITARGSVGRLALNAVPMAMNQSCYALKAKNGISFTFLFFLTKELIHHLEVKASGSVFNSIVSNDIEFTNLALPKERSLIEKFAAIAEPAFEKIEAATKENKQLSTLRDWLLPMLMNGQVTFTSSTQSKAKEA